MENIPSPGFSCSAPNLASVKVRNVADLKRIELQNQYLNKKLKSIMLKAKPTSISKMSVEAQKKRNTYILLNITPFLLLCTAFLLLAPLQSKDLL